MDDVKRKKRIFELKKMGHENGVYDSGDLANFYNVSLSTGKRYMQNKYRANIDRFQAHNEKFDGKVYGKYKPEWVVPIDIVLSIQQEELMKEIDWEELDKCEFELIKEEYQKYSRRDLLVEIQKLRNQISDLESKLISK